MESTINDIGRPKIRSSRPQPPQPEAMGESMRGEGEEGRNGGGQGESQEKLQKEE